MSEYDNNPHLVDEEVIREYIITREHVDLPDDLPEDIQEALASDPAPQTLQWVIDESHGDLHLLRLLLAREKLNNQFLDPNVDRSMLREDLQPIAQAISARKKELGLSKNYRF